MCFYWIAWSLQLPRNWCYYYYHWRRQWHPTPVLLPGKSMDRGAWWAAVHGVAKSRTRLSDFTFTFHFYALEKEMATHSSVLAWRIPGMGELGGLPSMGSHRVGHDWSDLALLPLGQSSVCCPRSCTRKLCPDRIARLSGLLTTVTIHL